ncbi:MAG TPA: hypothetical protein VEH27_16295 [Methylomirabilota bacterium]|nr:hypothetical protein [Methylomirabilota bacterium]
MGVRSGSLIIAVVCGLLSGCAHAPRPYPIGIYAVFKAEDVPTVAAAGFNHILGAADAETLRHAQQHGVKVFAQPGTQVQGFNPSAARKAIHQYDQHPSLRGWYIVDEPDLWNIAPADVKRVEKHLKRMGAKKPTVVVLGTGSAAADYAQLGDIALLDRYPVNLRPLASFGQHLRDVRLARPKAPLYAVIQAFDWKHYTNMVSGDLTQLRPPTAREIRCMTYLAVVNRVDGLFYYCWNDRKWVMQDHPETWEALQNVVADVHENAPLFQAQHVWWPMRVEHSDSPKLNEVGEASLAMACVEVKDGNSSVPRGKYLIAVNTLPQPLSVRIQAPGNPLPPLQALGEGRALSLEENGFFRDSFEPYEVHIYGPITPRP